MYKKVVKVGTSLGIVFSKHERDVHNIIYGTIIDANPVVEMVKK